jgi:hypothetical protein
MGRQLIDYWTILQKSESELVRREREDVEGELI